MRACQTDWIGLRDLPGWDGPGAERSAPLRRSAAEPPSLSLLLVPSMATSAQSASARSRTALTT
jgi:hypothetical protein